MNKYFEKFLELNRTIMDYLNLCGFYLCTKKRQNYLIEKNACMFLGLQKFAKKFDNDGDLRTSMHISGKSYRYLGNFAMYCDAKKIDQVTRLGLYV